MTRIIFACVGNSCRSQMAEAFCRAFGRDVERESAGSKDCRRVRDLIRSEVTGLLEGLGHLASEPHDNHQPLA